MRAKNTLRRLKTGRFGLNLRFTSWTESKLRTLTALNGGRVCPRPRVFNPSTLQKGLFGSVESGDSTLSPFSCENKLSLHVFCSVLGLTEAWAVPRFHHLGCCSTRPLWGAEQVTLLDVNPTLGSAGSLSRLGSLARHKPHLLQLLGHTLIGCSHKALAPGRLEYFVHDRYAKPKREWKILVLEFACSRLGIYFI